MSRQIPNEHVRLVLECLPYAGTCFAPLQDIADDCDLHVCDVTGALNRAVELGYGLKFKGSGAALSKPGMKRVKREAAA